MKLRIYAIKDTGTDTYGNIYCMINNGQAVRSFADELNRKDENNILSRHPTHFDLYLLGEYDTDTGGITTQAQSLLIRGIDAVSRPDPIA